MKMSEIFHIVYINMIENTFRLILTTLGIIVGTITIILVIAIGKGGELEAAKQFSNLSADTVYINLNYGAIGANRDISTVQKLDMDIIEAIMEETTTLKGLYLRASVYKEVGYKMKNDSFNLVGVTSGYSEISNILVEEGAEFSESDFLGGERVASIGSRVAERLFGSDDVVGSYIQIGDFRYRVVAIFRRSEDGLQGVDTDNSIFIPYQAMIKDKFVDKHTTTQAVGKAHDIAVIEQAKREIKSTLSYYMEDAYAYSVSDSGSRIEAATASAKMMKLLLLSVAIIVFIVGGIGIMNVMFVTVKERTKEIGILKALGAKENDILLLFLVEAFCIGVFSGLIGSGIGFFATGFMKYTDIPVYPTIDGQVIASLFAVVTSTLFGFYPAYKASMLMPVQALAEE